MDWDTYVGIDGPVGMLGSAGCRGRGLTWSEQGVEDA